jgi:hypothetical protein
MELKRTADRKVTNSVTKSGNVRIANSFSLPAGISCPGMTPYCNSICYAGRLEKVYPNFHSTVMHNYNALRDLRGPDMVVLLDAMLADFVRESNKVSAPNIFRIHADGDFFSMQYTAAWIDVMHKYNNVQFWVYTRVPESAIAIAISVRNCAVYFSADRDNIDDANRLKGLGIKIAMVADTFDEAKQLMGGTKAVRCPENNKSIPLIDPKGSACKRCGLCVFERNNVLFSKTKR